MNPKEIEIEKDLEKSKIIKQEKEITKILKDSRESSSDFSKLKLPHEIALEFKLTFNEMEKLIVVSDNKDLRREWTLYKEALKIFVAKDSKDGKNDLINSYNLGMGEKALPNITFIFDYKNELAMQDLNIMIEQTKVAKMKMQEKLKSLGVDINLEEEKEEKDIFDEISDSL